MTSDKNSTPGSCACGCGKPTLFGKVLAASQNGTKSRKQIAIELGLTYGHVKQIMLKPPRYLPRHWRREDRSKLRAAATYVVGGAGRYPSDRFVDYVHAFDLRLMAGATPARDKLARAQAMNASRAVSARWREVRRALIAAKRRAKHEARERDRETIEWLRNQVAVNWRTGDPPPGRLVWSLEALQDQNFGREVRDATQPGIEQQVLDRMELNAATRMLADPTIPDALIQAALDAPDLLTESDRAQLMAFYDRAERGIVGTPVAAVMAGEGTHRGWNLKRGRGRGRHKGNARTQPRGFHGHHEGTKDVSLDRAYAAERSRKEVGWLTDFAVEVYS